MNDSLRSSWRLRCALLVCTFALVACASAGPKPGGTTPASGSEAQGSEARGAGAPATARGGAAPDRAAHMQASFWKAIDVRDAVIGGDLERAKGLAASLAHEDFGKTVPEDWKHWVATMQQAADDVALAGDLDAAGRATGMLGYRCGECHSQKREASAELPPQDPRLADEGHETLQTRMYRHQLAADELWLALVDASEPLWLRGTQTLTRAPFEAPTRAGEAVDPALAADVEQLRALAKDARAAQTHPERAEIYGKIIARCGACHQKTAR